MAGLADFHADARRQLGGDAEPRAKNFQNERIAGADEFDAATDTDAESFQAIRVLVVRGDAAHDGADARRQLIKPHRGDRLGNSCHNEDKISLPLPKSNPVLPAVDANQTVKPFVFKTKGYPPQGNPAAGGLRFIVGKLHRAADED